MKKIRQLNPLLLLVLAVPSAYALFLYSPMLGAKLGLIDDHEFISFLTVGGQSWAGLPTMLQNSEIAKFGEFERFRPAYAFFRAVGSIVHGTDGFQWYLVRIGLFLAIIIALTALIYRLAERHFELGLRWAAAIAAISGLMISALASWNDIVSRLGPSELYVVWGLTVTGWGLVFLFERTNQTLGAVLVASGFALAVGSKENSISLIAPLLLALILAGLRGAKPVLVLLAGLVSAGATIFTAMGFLPPILEDGQDVYGQSRSLGNAFSAAFQLWPFWIGLLLFAVGAYLALKSELPKHQKLLAALLAGSPVFLIFSESFFYQYSITSGVFSPTRYGVLVELTGVLALVSLTLLGTLSFLAKRAVLKGMTLWLGLAVSLVPFGQIFTATSYRASAEQNANYLNAQYEAIESTSNYLKAEEIRQVLYVVDEPYDYERIDATKKYFKYLAGAERKYFLWTDFSKVQFDQFTAPLAEELETWSKDGNPVWDIEPLSALDQETQVLCVHFGANPDPSPCSSSQWIGG